MGLTPPSLKLKCGLYTNKAKLIISRAEKQLVNERIRVITNKLGQLETQQAHISQEIKTLLPENINKEVFTFTDRVKESEYQRSKVRQKNKLEILQKKKHKSVTIPQLDLSGTQLKKMGYKHHRQ